jgi:branched-chain amino acid transport system permease protein
MQFFQQLINGLTLGAIYALIALGYTMVYGVLRFINFAHGDVYMLGAYGGFFAASWFGIRQAIQQHHAPSFLAVSLVFLVTMLLCAAAGVLIEWLAYRPLRNSPRLASLITAIGVSMLLEFGGQAVFSPDPRDFPALLPATSLITAGNHVVLTSIQAIIIVVAFLLMVALRLIVMRTKIGRAMRAVSLDRTAASLMGINTDAIISFTFALGSALAAAGGVLNSVYTPTIDPLMGLNVGLKAFIAAVLGGIGNIPGAMLGGLLMGFAETGVAASKYSQYRDAVAFAILIGVLLLRPAGILGKTTAEKV